MSLNPNIINHTGPILCIGSIKFKLEKQVSLIRIIFQCFAFRTLLGLVGWGGGVGGGGWGWGRSGRSGGGGGGGGGYMCMKKKDIKRAATSEIVPLDMCAYITETCLFKYTEIL